MFNQLSFTKLIRYFSFSCYSFFVSQIKGILVNASRERTDDNVRFDQLNKRITDMFDLLAGVDKNSRIKLVGLEEQLGKYSAEVRIKTLEFVGR